MSADPKVREVYAYVDETARKYQLDIIGYRHQVNVVGEGLPDEESLVFELSREDADSIGQVTIELGNMPGHWRDTVHEMIAITAGKFDADEHLKAKEAARAASSSN